MRFTLTMPKKIVFGSGEGAKLPSLVAELGTSCLVVTAPALSVLADALLEGLREHGIRAALWAGVTSEPSPAMVHAAAQLAQAEGCEVVLGLGGGSAIDTAKAAAAMAVNPGSIVDYLEQVGTGRQLQQLPLPFVAVPTTAGTGAEVTKNAVISDPERGYKASLRSDHMLARVAVVDPALTCSAPPNVTAWSGMDALTQLIESYLSKKAQPVTDALALSGIAALAPNLAAAFHDGENLQAREGVAYGSHLSGICLANSGLGADHGIAGALGAVEGVPHGLACALLLAPVLAHNIPHVPQKAGPLCQALCGKTYRDPADNASAIVEFVRELSAELKLPAGVGGEVTQQRIARLRGAVSRSSMSGNPVELNDGDVDGLIREVL